MELEPKSVKRGVQVKELKNWKVFESLWKRIGCLKDVYDEEVKIRVCLNARI
jgi:hypothetical protein